MRLRIETTGVEFRTAGAAKAKKDWQNKELQARTPDNRPNPPPLSATFTP